MIINLRIVSTNAQGVAKHRNSHLSIVSSDQLEALIRGKFGTPHRTVAGNKLCSKCCRLSKPSVSVAPIDYCWRSDRKDVGDAVLTENNMCGCTNCFWSFGRVTTRGESDYKRHNERFRAPASHVKTSEHELCKVVVAFRIHYGYSFAPTEELQSGVTHNKTHKVNVVVFALTQRCRCSPKIKHEQALSTTKFKCGVTHAGTVITVELWHSCNGTAVAN